MHSLGYYDLPARLVLEKAQGAETRILDTIQLFGLQL